jgi:hypothetical protein
MYNVGISALDWLLAILFIVLSLTLSKLFFKGSQEDSSIFIKGLLVKYFFSMLFCVVIVYVYGGVGDSISFFAESLEARELVSNGQLEFLRYLKFNEDDFAEYGWPNHGSPSGAVVEKLSFLLSYIGNKSFLLVSLWFALIFYSGVWKFYTVAAKIYPNRKKIIQFGILFFPSVCFYSSGIFKDTIGYSALGWAIYLLYNLLIYNGKSAWKYIAFGFWLYILYVVRAYIFYSLTLALLYMLFIKTVNYPKFKRYKLLWVVGFLVIIVSIFFQFYAVIEEELASTFIKEILSNKNLYESIGGGSNFTLISGESITLFDLIRVFPLAIFTTLFRPFLWESASALMLFSSLENTIVLVLFVFALFKSGFKNFIYNLRTSPLDAFLLMYVIVFSGLVSIYTPNFGSLIRYRISAMPMLVLIIISIQTDFRANKTSSIHE